MEPQVYQCQQCKCRIVISASEMDPPSPGPSGQPSRLEESFMVLEDTLYRDRSATGDHAGEGEAVGRCHVAGRREFTNVTLLCGDSRASRPQQAPLHTHTQQRGAWRSRS